jgi:hypothetical protein
VINLGVGRTRDMNTFRALALVIVVAALVGCGESDPDEPSGEPVLTNGALVTYTRTGGVAGLDERLRIEPDGTATIAYGEPVDSEEPFDLSDAELERLTALLEAADFDSTPENPEQTGCADCFVYTVEYGGKSVTYDDVTQPAPSIAELVAALGEIAESNQPKAAGFIKGA